MNMKKFLSVLLNFGTDPLFRITALKAHSFMNQLFNPVETIADVLF